MKPSYETLDEALQAGVDNEESALQIWLTGAAIATVVREGFGLAGLNALAQALHKRRSTLEADISAFAISGLREGRPTLTPVHLKILMHVKDAEERKSWADLASDSNWSPAQLRREIAASRRQAQDASTVLAKAASWGERGKSVVDQAAEVGVLSGVEDRIEGVRQYVEAKKRSLGGIV